MVEMSPKGIDLEYGASSRPLAGQEVSGDSYAVRFFGTRALIAAVDGLGHGEEAAHAAEVALAVCDNATEPLPALFQRCHEKLKSTRGAVLAVAVLDAEYNTISWMGVGNVQGTLVRADARSGAKPRENLMSFGGLLGGQLPQVKAAVLPISIDDILVMVTDGIRTDYASSILLHSSPGEIAACICRRHLKGNDDALAVVARYKGRHP